MFLRAILFFCLVYQLMISPSVILASDILKDTGIRKHTLEYREDTLEILIASKRGEENQKKSVIFFCQGSMPVPLVLHDGGLAYGVFPFDPAALWSNFHLLIVSKPGIPLEADIKTLNPDFTYTDSAGFPPQKFLQNDNVSYYVSRNNFILKKLSKEPWFSDQQIIVAGHSAGATIATKMAVENKKITHLIYASGNLMGRIVTMYEQNVQRNADSANNQSLLDYWKYLNETNPADLEGSSNSDLTFSQPVFDDLLKLKIEVLISYGTRDLCAPFLRYLQLKSIMENNSSIHFQSYHNLDHNFFGADSTGHTDYEDYNWDRVANDWQKWLTE